MSKQPITNVVKKAIKQSGLTRYAIAQASGVNESALSLFVAGKRGLTLASVDRLASVLKLNMIVVP